jgi:hypothetical protein
MTTHEDKLLNTIREDILIDYLAQDQVNHTTSTLQDAENRVAVYVEMNGYDNVMRWMTNINPTSWVVRRTAIEQQAEKQLEKEIENSKMAAQEDEMEQEEWRRAVQGYEEAGTYMGRG